SHDRSSQRRPPQGQGRRRHRRGFACGRYRQRPRHRDNSGAPRRAGDAFDTVAQWADETKRLIDAEGGVSQIVEGDVSAPASCQAIVARTAEAWGRLDILVNNVGITGPRGNAVEVDVEAWDSAMRVNVASMMLMAKYAIPEMIRSGGGSIINLSSVAGLSGGHPSLLYPTSKGAIVSLTR